MKIESVTGCNCDSLTVDGVETVDLDIQQVKEAAKKLIDFTDDLGTLQSIIIDVIETKGNYEDLGQCNGCEDLFITKYTIEV